MSEYTLEDDIPAPTTKTGPKRKYPLDRMKVGQSFEVPLKHTSYQIMVGRIRSAIKTYKIDKSWKFVFAKTENNGVRCWRTK